jgi:hypothetical protein
MGIKKVKKYGAFANNLASTVDAFMDVKNTKLKKYRKR